MKLFLFLLGMVAAGILGYSFEQPAVPSAPVFYDLVTAIAFRILREVCGPTWKAALVQLSHSPPDNPTPYRRVFGPRVRFDQEISGVLFDSSWLDRALPDADVATWHSLNREIQTKQARLPLSFSESST